MHFDIVRLNVRKKINHPQIDHRGFSTLTKHDNEISVFELSKWDCYITKIKKGHTNKSAQIPF